MENNKNERTGDILDNGPFYHGTKADLQIGDLLTAGFGSNYYPEIIMNHIYFTALKNGAGLAAALAQGEGNERIYIVEPTGDYENDPNVTDKKFPGNPTRSYRSKEPLKIVGEVTEWIKLTDDEIQRWKENLKKIRENPNAEIIN
ncbi:NAD(+)--rifampin ADP-ribosyltransferase [Chryseobacterium paridis]|uniref:NAD(+)--rifampin ADP-ribosyltransferase n=1 Tax=Chryseobacterium paridis TaxID=2800328 RepID=A0ABS1G004_9FLAO|nr:NAD(+)--rifampin ADP-ribosyltransferase [Chryseobacterium paridis]MBK1898028.1 NAD(+)--rifampin ADP-ribosyltransferase [Chryseobacterium paridis]